MATATSTGGFPGQGFFCQFLITAKAGVRFLAVVLLQIDVATCRLLSRMAIEETYNFRSETKFLAPTVLGLTLS